MCQSVLKSPRPLVGKHLVKRSMKIDILLLDIEGEE